MIHQRMRVALAVTVAALAVLIGISLWPDWRFSPDVARPHPTTAAAALTELRAGNARYVASHRTLSINTAHDADERRELARGQHPFAAVLTCSDSRVCPEFVFDQRPGSLFEIRNAGNLVDDDVMASFEYAVEHLHVPLLVVLGHTGCGAIQAVHEADGKPLPHHLRALQEHMAGLGEEMHHAHDDHSPDVLNRFARENARQQALILLRDSRPIHDAVRLGHARLVYALYNIESGEVEFADVSVEE
jgi:carbonic anhydrase